MFNSYLILNNDSQESSQEIQSKKSELPPSGWLQYGSLTPLLNVVRWENNQSRILNEMIFVQVDVTLLYVCD